RLSITRNDDLGTRDGLVGTNYEIGVAAAVGLARKFEAERIGMEGEREDQGRDELGENHRRDSGERGSKGRPVCGTVDPAVSRQAGETKSARTGARGDVSTGQPPSRADQSLVLRI